MKWYEIRKKFIYINLILVIGLSLLYFSLIYSEPNKPKFINIPDAPFQKIWSNKKTLLLGMGDSILTGYGAGGEEFSFFEMITNNPKNDFPEMRNKNLKKVFPNISIKNIAENSSSSGDHIYQIDEIKVQPNDIFGIVILSTGGIDLIHDYGNSPPEDEAIYGSTKKQIDNFSNLFEKRLSRLLEKIKSKFPGGVKIFIFEIYDPTDGVGDIENVNLLLKILKKLPAWKDGLYALDKWNSIIKNSANNNDYVETIDIHGEFLGHGIHYNDKSNPYYRKENPTYWYYYNLEDPNKEGYDAIRRLVLLKMIDIFYKK